MAMGISKGKVRSIYSINKTNQFWEKARKFLIMAGVFQSYPENFGWHLDNHEEKTKEKDIFEVKDTRESFTSSDEKDSIDFIFGEKKIFVIISYKKDRQQKYSKLIFESFGE
jgi:hypothetical protein